MSHIPLIIRFPGGAHAGETCDELVSLIDIAPTVVGLLGIERPPTFDGLDLRDAMAGGDRWRRDAIFQECWGWEELSAIRTKDHFIIRDRASRRARFFDLKKDPEEQDPRPRAMTKAALELANRLKEFLGRRPAGEGPPELDAETIERLRELGYIDGGG